MTTITTIHTSYVDATTANDPLIVAIGAGIEVASGPALTNVPGNEITLVNAGTVSSIASGPAILLSSGGAITNGAGALIAGVGAAIQAGSLMAITNFSRITGGDGIVLTGGGSIANGSLSETAASITGTGGLYGGVLVTAASSSVENFGSIAGTAAGRAGVTLLGGGTVDNGVAGLDPGAQIAGGAAGVAVKAGVATIDNAGTIEGAVGVSLLGTTSGTLTDSGLIESSAGAAGVAVQLGRDTLLLQPGARFIGQVQATGGALELAAGAGRLAGLGTAFTGFKTIAVDAGADWVATGPAIIAGSLVDHGSLAFSDTVSGGGSIEIGIGGALTLGQASSVAKIVFGGTGSGQSLQLNAVAHFVSTIVGFAAGRVIDLAHTLLTKFDYTQTSATAGTLTLHVLGHGGFTAVPLTLAGSYAAAGFHTASDGAGGTAITYAPPPLT